MAVPPKCEPKEADGSDTLEGINLLKQSVKICTPLHWAISLHINTSALPGWGQNWYGGKKGRLL